MIIAVVSLLVGLLLLTFMADRFVDGAVAVASAAQLSPVVVGALVIGFGTSLPEMLVSAIAAFQGDSDLGVGNVVGSNVANLSLVLGTAALITPLAVPKSVLRRELPLAVGAVVLFYVLVQRGLDRVEGAILLAGMIGAVVLLVKGGAVEPEDNGNGDPLMANIVRTIVGLAGTVGGSWLLVRGALAIAERFGLTGGFVGLTLVAVGTSLPELVTAITAAKKGETELIIGNLLGSNIFNSFAVGAVLGLVGPGPLTDGNLSGIGAIAMVAVSICAAIFMLLGSKVVRWQALVLLGIYLATIPFTS